MTDPASHLIETFEDGIATLTMNRPEARNALSPEMTACLEEAVPRLARDPAVRVLVVTGAGDAFCEGGDVKGFVRTASAPPGAERPGLEQRVAGLRDSMELVRWLHEMPKPTLAVIPGPARRLADLPTIALGYMKKNLNAAEHDTLGDVLDLEAPHMIRTFETEDHRRSARAFVDKVAPEFRGR